MEAVQVVAVRGVVGVTPADVAGDLRLDLRALEVAGLSAGPCAITDALQRTTFNA